MAFRLGQISYPNLTTDYSGEINAAAQLGKTIAGLPEQWRKQAEEDRVKGLLGEAMKTGDYGKAGMALLGAGKVQEGAALIGLGQKAQERDLERQWLGGNAAPALGRSSQPVAGPASLIQNESGGRWDAQNDATGAGGMKGHFGRLQFGQARLQEAAAAGAIPPGTTPQQFMASPELQQAAERWHFNDIDQNIKASGYDRLVGQPINGVPVTIDGLRAVAHLGGVQGMKRFVETGGRYDPADRNGTRLSDYFARHGGGGAQPAAPVQTAQAAPQPGQPVSDAPAPEGFAVPAGENEFQQRSIMSDKGVQAAQQRLATAPTERTRAIAQTQLNLAIKDAEQRFADGKAPEAVREWQWARRNGLTEAKSPVAYAKEKAEATRQDSAPTTRTIKQADGSEVIVQWNSETKNWDPLRAPAGGEAVRPTGTKLTEGQSKDLIYHSRGLQALEAFEPVSAAYADGVSRVAAQVPGGNYVVSEEFQKARQAGRNFLASVLRKDTGAAVTPSEEQLYGDIFLPAPGDKPGTLAQKAEARRQAIDAIRNGLGTAEVLALGKKLTSRQPGQDAPAGAPAPQAAPAAPAAAPAPARPAGGQPRTATNPNTGQRLMETPDGQWVPIDG